jgi:diguanylate cyclase (GGDEF)-like protein
VVIAIDDESNRRMDLQWPWSREVYSRALAHLADLRPAVVAMDFVLIGRGPEPDSDRALAETLKKLPNLVLASYFTASGEFFGTHPVFSGGAQATGFVNHYISSDDVIRLGNVVWDHGGKTLYAFAVETAYRFLGLNPRDWVQPYPDRVRFGLPEPGGTAVRFREATVEAQSTIWISYRYRDSDFKIIPFWRLYENRIEPSEIAGKLVLLGTTASVFHEIHPSPFGMIPGVLIQANYTLQFLEGDFIRRMPRIVEFCLALLGLLLIALTRSRRQQIARFFCTSLFSLSILALSLALFIGANLILDTLSILFIVSAAYGIFTGYQLLTAYMENRELEHEVNHDNLTDLYSARYFQIKAGRIFDEFRQENRELCYAMMDVDNFKKINDNHGHDAGNAVLKAVGGAIKNNTRRHDLAARFGGDEFVVLFLDAGIEAVKMNLERIRSEVRAIKLSGDASVPEVTLSIGVASSRHPDVKSADDLLHFADGAMYRVKKDQRDGIQIHA